MFCTLFDRSLVYNERPEVRLFMTLAIKLMDVTTSTIFIYNLFLFNNNEFATTLTELRAIAAPAITGFNNHPVKG